MFLLYKTDNWHNYASRDLLALCTTKKKVIQFAKEQAKKEGVKLSEDDLYNLENISQTQGFRGAGEFHFEQMEANKLL
jgi:hypothetical protein